MEKKKSGMGRVWENGSAVVEITDDELEASASEQKWILKIKETCESVSCEKFAEQMIMRIDGHKTGDKII